MVNMNDKEIITAQSEVIKSQADVITSLTDLVVSYQERLDKETVVKGFAGGSHDN